MEKKAVKKAPVKKKAVATPKEIKPTSPWTEVATELSEPPVVTGGSTSSPRRRKAKTTTPVATKSASQPPVLRGGAMKAKKTKSAPKAAAAGAVSEPPVVTGGLVKAKKTKSAPKRIAPDLSVPPAVAGGLTSSSKPVRSKKAARTKTPTLDATAEIAAAKPQVELSPVFKTLAAPTLPELQRENRARLMMQTPTQLYFYWSVKENPYHLLRKAFGDDMGSYTLVLKLTELNSGTEVIHRAEAEGNYWFDVQPDGKYEAEIGFYAPNRPYFRVIYSNTVETPRRNPSPRQATNADWKVPAHKFAEVLEVAGFSQDAFDVAMAGDDHAASEQVTHTAFKSFIGTNGFDLRGIAAEDIRYSLMALASGLKLDELRSRISPALYAILQSNAEKIAAGKAMNALTEYFDIDESEFTEHKYGSAVYGASLVNFPRTLTSRRKYTPLSSHTLAR
jgi:hypothetical protein